MNDLLKKIVEWNEANEYQKCVDAIEAIQEEERGYELTVLLGRVTATWECLAIIIPKQTRMA